MERWRLLEHDGVGSAAGLAVDEALMTGYGRDVASPPPPTLRLYTYASHCALVGRFQNVEAEVDLEACERTGTPVGRRPTGGGAIIMGDAQLGVALVTRAPAERPKDLIRGYAKGIARGLAELGIQASFRGKNDLEVGGRKIAGLGLYLDDHGGLLFHSSILADLDIEAMLKVLRIPAAKLGDKAIAAVSERVTTVARETGRSWSAAELRPVIALGFEKEFGVALDPGVLTEVETEKASLLERTKYSDAAWVFQRSPSPDRQGTAAFKTPDGFVRVHIALENGAIKSVLFTGDFNELPDGLVRVESALRWARLDPERVSAIVARAVGEEKILQISPEQIAGAVMEAGERASARDLAHPDRQGSCYFPEVG